MFYSTFSAQLLNVNWAAFILKLMYEKFIIHIY